MAEIESVKIPIISVDQTGPGFSSATGNTKKFSQSIRQMSEEYETSTGRSFRAMSRGLDISTFGLISFAAIAMKTFEVVKKYLEDSVKAYDKSGLAGQQYISIMNEAEKDTTRFEVSTGEKLSGMVEWWNKLKIAAYNALDETEKSRIKAGERRGNEAAVKSALGLPLDLSANTPGSPNKIIAEIITAAHNGKITIEKEVYALSAFNAKLISEIDKQLQAGWKAEEAETKRHIDAMLKQLDTAMQKLPFSGGGKDFTGANAFIAAGMATASDLNAQRKAKKNYYNTLTDISPEQGQQNKITIEDTKQSMEDFGKKFQIQMKDIKTETNATKVTWKDWANAGVSAFDMLAKISGNASSKIISDVGNIAGSLITMATGGPLGFVTGAMGIVGDIASMFSGSSSSSSSSSQAATAAKTASHYDSVTRQGPQIYNITPTIVITSQNGVQVFGDSSVTTGSLMNLIRQALQRDISNNAINLAGAAPAGAGL
jgi:hypothetical protein